MPFYQAVGRDGPDVRNDTARVGIAATAKFAAAPKNSRMAGTASKNQLTSPAVSVSVNNSPSIKDDEPMPVVVAPAAPAPAPTPAPEPKPDNRDAERSACLNSNIGIGNTFVWASRLSNTTNYASMQEDTKNPENNVCFVKVDLKTADSEIDISGFPSRYFQWGSNIECGSWVNEKDLEKRILDAKKKKRVLATVGASVGGAALGVGAMEAFGNKMIGGKVQGQKNTKLTDTEKLRSQLLVLKKDNDPRFKTFQTDLRKLKEACDTIPTKSDEIVDLCNFDYATLLAL